MLENNDVSVKETNNSSLSFDAVTTISSNDVLHDDIYSEILNNCSFKEHIIISGLSKKHVFCIIAKDKIILRNIFLLIYSWKQLANNRIESLKKKEKRIPVLKNSWLKKTIDPDRRILW